MQTRTFSPPAPRGSSDDAPPATAADEYPPPPYPLLWAATAALTAVFTLWSAWHLHTPWPFGSYCRCTFVYAVRAAAYNVAPLFALAAPALWAFRRVAPPTASGHRILAASTGVMVAAVLASGVVRYAAGLLLLGGPRSLTRELVFGFNEGFSVYASVIAWEMARLSAWRARRATAALREHEANLVRARLAILLGQLHPHFLFNALNSISSLIRVDPARGREMVAQLRELLDVALRDPREPVVTLREELHVLGLYLALEQVRFHERLRFRFDVPAELQDAAVPQLLLQPLVENAVRHGLARRPEGGEVVVSARALEDGMLRLRVADTGVGLEVDAPARGGGHGTANTRARLRERFGERQRFELYSPRAGGAVAEVTLPHAAVGAPVEPAPRAAEERIPFRTLWSLRRWAWVVVAFWTLDGLGYAAAFLSLSGAARSASAPLLAVADVAANVTLMLAAVAAAFRWPLRRDTGVKVAAFVVALSVAAPFWVVATDRLLGAPVLPLAQHWALTPLYLLGGASILSVGYALRYAILSGVRESESAVAEAQLRRRELESLRDRLDRAFVWRTLARIEELIGPDARRAERVLCRFSDLLRAVLQQSSTPTVALHEEVETLRRFEALKEALGEPVRVAAAMDGAGDARVPRHLVLAWVRRIAERVPGAPPLSISAERTRGGSVALELACLGEASAGAEPARVREACAEVRDLFARDAAIELDPLPSGARLRLVVPAG